MVTPVIHPKIVPLRELVQQYDNALTFAKLTFARELIDRMLTVLGESLEHVDRLETRIRALEQSPYA